MSTKYIASNWRLPNKAGVDSYLNDNYGLTFDGNELIECENISSLNNVSKFSISFWFKISDFSSVARFLGTYSGNTNNWLMCLFVPSTGLRFLVRNNDTSKADLEVVSSGKITLNNWQHVSMVYDGNESGNANRLKVYLNGVQESLTFTGTIPATTASNLTGVFNIGSDGYSSQGAKDISEVAVFDYSLSSTQISTLYGSSSLGAGNPLALKPAPVAFYPLGDNSSGNPLTQPNEAVEDASVFDFVPNDYINIPDSDSLSFGDGTNDSPFSISAWINVDDTTTNRIVSKTTLGNPEYLFTTGTAANTLVLNMYDQPATVHSGPYRGKAGTTSFNSYVGEWVHVVATYDGRGGDTANDGINLYFNAALESTTNITAGTYQAMSNTSAPVRIGADPTWTNVYFDGQISNVQIWNTELSSSEVSTLYNSGVPLLTGTQPQTNNLKAWYKLDQSANWDVSGSGYWDIPDASGNGNSGISSGMTSSNLVLTDLTRNLPYDSYSFNFDSTSDDHINCGNPSALNITGSITLSCWVKSSNTAANYKLLIKDNGTSRSFQINTNHASLGPYVYFWTDGGTIVTTNAGTPNVLVDGNWHNLVCMFKSGDYVRMYIDGIQVGNTSVTQTTLDSSTADFIISTDGNNGTVGVDGNVSNVSVFNEALTSTEVMKLYSNGVPQDLSTFTPAPVAWWTLGSNSFFNGSNFICKDLSGNGNDGTSVNAGVDALQGNTPRSEANGTGTNQSIPENLVGTTKYSSNNSWSINMSESARVADTP